MFSDFRFRVRASYEAGQRRRVVCRCSKAERSAFLIVVASTALSFLPSFAEAKPRKFRPLINPGASKQELPPKLDGAAERKKSESAGLPHAGKVKKSSNFSPAPDRAIESDEPAAESRKIRLPLSIFADGEKRIRLQGENAERKLSVPINPRMRVISGEIGLSFVPSISLSEKGSHISLYWNGQAILEEAPVAPSGSEGLRLEGRLQREHSSAGKNELRIEINHRVADNVDGSSAGRSLAALWTEVDLEKSWIELACGWGMPDLEISGFPALVRGHPWMESRLAVVTPSLRDGSDDYLRWGGWLSRWVALSGDPVPLELSHHTELAGVETDAVVIGTSSELQHMVSDGLLQRVGSGDNDAPGVFFNPAKPRYLVLLLSGNDRETVGRNVLRFVQGEEALQTTGETEPLSVRSPFAFGHHRHGGAGQMFERKFEPDLHVASRDSDTVSSAWMLAARIAQGTGGLPAGMEITGLSPSGDRDWLMVGAIPAIPQKVLSASPVMFPYGDRLPELLVRSPGHGSGEGTRATRQWNGDSGDVVDGGLLMQFDSPFAANRIATVVTANDSRRLREAVKKMLPPEVWNQMEGDTIAWAGDRGNRVENREFHRWSRPRHSESNAAGDRAFFRNPLGWLGTSLVVSMTVLLLLRGRRAGYRPRRFHPDPSEELPAL